MNGSKYYKNRRRQRRRSTEMHRQMGKSHCFYQLKSSQELILRIAFIAFSIHPFHSRPSTSLNVSEVRKVRFKYEYCNSRHAIANEIHKQETTTDSILYAEISKRNCIDSKYPSIKTPLARHAHMLAITNGITKRFHLKHGITPLVMLPCAAHQRKRTHTLDIQFFKCQAANCSTLWCHHLIA